MEIKIMRTIPLILTIGSGFMSTALIASDSPNPRQLHITSFLYDGNGCPDGTAASSISTDGEAITVLFDEYQVEVGPNNPTSQKNCKMRIGINVPPGWTFGLFGVAYSGYAFLDDGVKGVQKSMFRFGRNQGEKEVGKMILKGNYDDDYINETEVSLDSINWAPCRQQTKNLILRTTLKLNNKGNHKEGFMTLDSMDGEVKHEYNIAWKKCNPNDGQVPPTPNQPQKFCKEGTIFWSARGIVNNRNGGNRGGGRTRRGIRPGRHDSGLQQRFCSAEVGNLAWGSKKTLVNLAEGKSGQIKLVCKRGKWRVKNPRRNKPTCINN